MQDGKRRCKFVVIAKSESEDEKIPILNSKMGIFGGTRHPESDSG